jgi:hypothetical protein
MRSHPISWPPFLGLFVTENSLVSPHFSHGQHPAPSPASPPVSLQHTGSGQSKLAQFLRLPKRGAPPAHSECMHSIWSRPTNQGKALDPGLEASLTHTQTAGGRTFETKDIAPGQEGAKHSRTHPTAAGRDSSQAAVNNWILSAIATKGRSGPSLTLLAQKLFPHPCLLLNLSKDNQHPAEPSPPLRRNRIADNLRRIVIRKPRGCKTSPYLASPLLSSGCPASNRKASAALGCGLNPRAEHRV